MDGHTWHQEAAGGWTLRTGKDIVVALVPDETHRAMFRLQFEDGVHSDMTNLSWAKQCAEDYAQYVCKLAPAAEPAEAMVNDPPQKPREGRSAIKTTSEAPTQRAKTPVRRKSRKSNG